MALAVDSSSTIGAQTASSSWSWAHTCASGSVLFVAVSSNGTPPTGVTYNGDALTKAVEKDYSTSVNVTIWYILSPDTGSSYNVVVSFSAGMYGDAGAVSFTGADTSSQPDCTASETGTSTTTNVLNITTNTDNCYILDALAVESTWLNTAPEEDGTQTQVYDTSAVFLAEGSSYKSVGSAGAQTMTWTWTVNFGLAARYVHCGVGVKPAGAGTNYEKALSDSFSMTDSLVRGSGKVASDSMSFTDSITNKVVDVVKTDSMTFGDEIGTKWNAKRTLTDTISLADTTSKGVSTTKSEAVAISEASLSKKYEKPLTETISLADSLSKGVAVPKEDSITFSDSLVKLYSGVKADTLTITDVGFSYRVPRDKPTISVGKTTPTMKSDNED